MHGWKNCLCCSIVETKLVGMEPTTMAGVLALLRYLAEFQADGNELVNHYQDDDDPAVSKRGGSPTNILFPPQPCEPLERLTTSAVVS